LFENRAHMPHVEETPHDADYWNADTTVPNFTDPKVEEAFQFLVDVMDKYKDAPSPSAYQKIGGSPFTAGRAAMSHPARLAALMEAKEIIDRDLVRSIS
jgi:ABC-type glycerol-3-phosphate transport system substrate-binding protein